MAMCGHKASWKQFHFLKNKNKKSGKERFLKTCGCMACIHTRSVFLNVLIPNQYTHTHMHVDVYVWEVFP